MNAHHIYMERKISGVSETSDDLDRARRLIELLLSNMRWPDRWPPIPNGSPPTPPASAEDIKSQQLRRYELSKDLYYLQLVPPLTRSDLIAADKFVSDLPNKIRTLSKMPFLLGTFSTMVTDYLEQTGSLEDEEWNLILKGLKIPSSEEKIMVRGETLSLWWGEAGAALGLGYLAGKWLMEKILDWIDDDDDGDEKTNLPRRSSILGTTYADKPSPNTSLDIVGSMEIVKRAVARPDYIQFIRVYGPVIGRVVSEDDTLAGELLAILDQQYQEHSKEKRNVLVIGWILLGLFVLGAAMGMCDACEEHEKEKDKKD